MDDGWRRKLMITHHPSSIIHHPSSIIHHPRTIIQHHPTRHDQFSKVQRIDAHLLVLLKVNAWGRCHVRSSSVIHHPSSIIHHPSSIIHHPSSVIHPPHLPLTTPSQQLNTVSRIHILIQIQLKIKLPSTTIGGKMAFAICKGET